MDVEGVELEDGIQFEEKITEKVHRASYQGSLVVVKRIPHDSVMPRLLRSLDHEHIMRMVGLVDELLLMEDCGSAELALALPSVDGESVMAQLLSACQFMHERMIRHGNISPYTVMVKCQKVKLVDFRDATFIGFCNLEGRVTAFGAPEIADGTATTLADMWSIGLVYYAVAAKTLTWGVPYSEHVLSNPVQDARIMYAIRTCLQLDPRRRFTASMMLDYLEHFMGTPTPQPLASEFHVALSQFLRGEIPCLSRLEDVAANLDCLVAFAVGRWNWACDLSSSQSLLTAWETAIEQGGTCSKPRILLDQLIQAGRYLPAAATRILMKLDDELILERRDEVATIVVEGLGNHTAIEPVIRMMQRLKQSHAVKLLGLIGQQAQTLELTLREAEAHKRKAEGLQGYIDSIKNIVNSGI